MGMYDLELKTGLRRLPHARLAAPDHPRFRRALHGRPRRRDHARATVRRLLPVPLAAPLLARLGRRSWPSPRACSATSSSRAAKAFRITGHGAAAWTGSETTKLIFGVGYFNRLEVKMLPIGGLIWTPNEDVSFELLFPQPRPARRRYPTGQFTQEVQDWVYLSAEFGGGNLGHRPRRCPEPDLVDITDYRLILGFEPKRFHSLCTRFEVGYVFGRRVQFRDGDPRVRSEQHGDAPRRAEVLSGRMKDQG